VTRALVTGANGLIGSHLVGELLARGYDVRGLVRKTSDLRSLGDLDLELAEGDVRDAESLARATRDCEIVFHTAATFRYWGASSRELEATALVGTENVLRAAGRAGCRRVVLTSSSVVCGSDATTRLRDESDGFEDPDGPAYFRSKHLQEEAAGRIARELGMELVSVLPTMTIGAHDHRLVPSNEVIVNYLRDPFRFTYPGGINVVAVADVASGHVLIAEEGRAGERYLLGGENLEYSLLHRHVSELCGLSGPGPTATHTACLLAATAFEAWAAVTGGVPPMTRAQARVLGRFFWYSHARAAALGYAPRPARRALAEAIAWLVTSEHVSNELRRQLRLSREVYEARAPGVAA
jgi:dihydroflavonol-4-reductase